MLDITYAKCAEELVAVSRQPYSILRIQMMVNITLTYDVEIVLGKGRILLQEFAQEDVGVLGCVCVICMVVCMRL